MSLVESNLVQSLKAAFPQGLTYEQFRDNQRVIVPRDQLFAVMTWLKETGGCNMLVDVTCVDYLEYPDATHRFGVVYCLLNMQTNERLVVKTYVDEPDLHVPSMWPLWRSADWTEREVYDMFGIIFDGHPDLRRILMPPEFVSFPLRKDYPLKGRGERHNFPVITRAES
jgi:NADH-quinone oxidoreductase subunit C